MSVMAKKQKRINKVARTDAYFMQNEEKQELLNYINTHVKDVKTSLDLEYNKEGKKQMKKLKRKSMPHNKKQYQVYFMALVGMFCILSFSMWLFLPPPLNLIMSFLIWAPLMLCLINYVTNKRNIQTIN